MNEQKAPTNEQLEKQAQNYNDKSFLNKIKLYGKKIGAKIVYKALQLFYLLKKKEVPLKVKLTIAGALAYLVLPLDLIPDFIPIVGFGDDAAAILSAIGMASIYIDENINEKAKKKFDAIFGEGSLNNTTFLKH